MSDGLFPIRQSMPIPGNKLLIIYAELHQNLSYDVINLFFDGIRPIIEGQHRWHYHTSIVCRFMDIPEMNASHRHFPWYNDHFPSLFKANIHRSEKQIVCITADNSGYRLHAAGNNYHPIRFK